MIVVDTADLIGSALDWAIAVVVHGKVYVYPDGGLCPPEDSVQMNEDDGSLWVSSGGFHPKDSWAPSTDWSQGGPLISKHMVSLHCPQSTDDVWAAWVITDKGEFCHGGESALIAACRAIVAAKLGDTVSVPKELMP